MPCYLHQQGTPETRKPPAARLLELWAKLGVGRDFTNWIKGRISEYEFVEGTDFDVGSDLENLSKEVFARSGENSKNGRPRENYWLALSTAKEFSMVERTPQGRQARSYFIDCERKLTNAMLANAVAAAQSQQPSHAQLEDKADQDARDLADSNILCKLARLKADRTWLLAMRQYGTNLF